jgi:hypothetical protein
LQPRKYFRRSWFQGDRPEARIELWHRIASEASQALRTLSKLRIDPKNEPTRGGDLSRHYAIGESLPRM